MHWITLGAGLAAGFLNYALLARGCKRLTGGGKHGALWILGGICVPVASLVVCAGLAPAMLPWFGCAAGGILALLAIGHMCITLIRSRKSR